MGQSLVQNYIHIIFSTKNREPFILPKIENDLFSYLGGICNKLECTVLKVGGHLDHVHILCMLSKKIALMKLLEVVKANSSGWIKTNGEDYSDFYWQNGYGAFSVKHADVQSVIDYIENQKEHHSKSNFKDEFRTFLKKYEVSYDEKYVWD
jgi:putative transposase